MKLLKNANVYTPKNIGRKDVLIEGSRIIRVQDHIDGYDALEDVEVFDLEGKQLCPGFIDIHVHILGGGGEDGPASRVPGARSREILSAGCTTILGLLGIDGISRSNEELVVKARAFEQEGLTCFALVSNYAYPCTTITGSVEKDILMIDPVIGVKSALSDHRDSNISVEELIRLASEARRGGMLSGKAGIVQIHVGAGPRHLDKLLAAAREGDVPLTHMIPTHVGERGETVLQQALEYVDMGGFADITAGGNLEEMADTAKTLARIYEERGSFERISLSSDAYGSLPVFDEEGNVTGISYVTCSCLLQTLKILMNQHHVPVEACLTLLTTTPASILKKEGVKGSICAGADADLLVFDENWEIRSIFSRGRLAMQEGEMLIKGVYE